MYKPYIKEGLAMAEKMLNKHAEDADRFIFDYKIQELYDQNGEIYQQLTPFLLIDFKK